jgi:hypothetical protein
MCLLENVFRNLERAIVINGYHGETVCLAVKQVDFDRWVCFPGLKSAKLETGFASPRSL